MPKTDLLDVSNGGFVEPYSRYNVVRIAFINTTSDLDSHRRRNSWQNLNRLANAGIVDSIAHHCDFYAIPAKLLNGFVFILRQHFGNNLVCA